MKLSERWVMCVLVLGYFIDSFDITLFNFVREASLRGLGVPDDQNSQTGAMLLNFQLVGLLVGGLLWGMYADKVGRVKALFGSIAVYGVATFANAYVTSVEQYAVCRLIAGIGAGGEAGVTIALVSEIARREKRAYGIIYVAVAGALAAVVAAMLVRVVEWQTMYVIGGGMALVLLAARWLVAESDIFLSASKTKNVALGNLSLILRHPERRIRFLACCLLGMPLWFLGSVVVFFAPEITAEMGFTPPFTSAEVGMFGALGIVFGDVLWAWLSQVLQSRKRAMALSLGSASLMLLLFTVYPLEGNAAALKAVLLVVGICTGLPALYMTMVAEQFGTNVRGLVTSTATNIMRATSIVMVAGYTALFPIVGYVGGVQVVGGVVLACSVMALYLMRETYAADLNFIEK